LHFEKLTGDRIGEYSIRLNKQWRLTLVITSDEDGNYLVILDIEVTCAGYIAHPSEYLGNGDAKSLKIGYFAGQS